ncbi:thiamine-phosphate synthase [mine drainage metagenome]|uniref:thiamine phosphate synthase n=1 Tax=mine drainage metagenome TaxID=410659 RepID=A0A1J5QK75_9ZZZZ
MQARFSGLYAVTPDLADTPRLLGLVEAALQGGASLLQYRNKQASAARRMQQAGVLLALCRQYGVPLIINDHVELCRTLDADGVHLGGNDADVAAARAQLGSGKIIGASCYDRLDLAAMAKAAGADYVAFGSCFGSSTKPLAIRAPLELFSQARQQIGLPLVAIGGIDAENAGLAMAAGADALAVISAVFAVPEVRLAAQFFSNLYTRNPSEPNPS